MRFGLDFIRKLKPAAWKYNEINPDLEDGREHHGFFAQDVDAVVPKEEHGFVTVTEGGFLKLNMAEFIGPIVKALQELDEEVRALKKE